MSIPSNLQLLHGGEEELRAKTLEFVRQSPDLVDHLDLMERTMDILDMLRKHHDGTDDAKTIVQLGMRCFNSFAAAWKLTASGYYQAAVATLRDLIETSELVDYFHGKNLVVINLGKTSRNGSATLSIAAPIGEVMRRAVLDHPLAKEA